MCFHHNNNILNFNVYISNRINTIKKSENIKNINLKELAKINIYNNNIDNSIIPRTIIVKKQTFKSKNKIDINQNLNKTNFNDKMKILNLINIMKELFLFEKNICSNNNNSFKEDINSGYFINKRLVDKWKFNINYEKIKENFFEKYLKNDRKMLTNEQKNEILNYILKLNNNIDINNNIRLISLNNLEEKEFEFFTKTNSFILINKNLYELINDKKDINENAINYYINNNIINFQFKSLNCTFYIYENIIFSKLDSNAFLLIKYYIFEEELKKNIGFNLNNTSKTYIMINKDFIDEFKENFKYDFIRDYIENENIINIENNSINDKMIYTIVQNMPKYIKKLISFNIKTDLNYLNLNLFEEEIEDKSNRKKFKYFKNFGIIDSNIYFYMKPFIGTDNNFILGNLFFIKNKILIIFKFKESDKYYFQIGYIDGQNRFMNNYIIDINYDKTKIKNINYFNESINKYIFNNVYNNLSTNTFILENKVCYFYKISENYNFDFNEISNKNYINTNKQINNGSDASFNKTNKNNFNNNLKIVSNLNNINYLSDNNNKNMLLKEIKDLNKKLKNEKNKNKKLSEEKEMLKNNLNKMKNNYINIEKKSDYLKIELENEIKRYKELEEKTNKELKDYNLIKKGSKDSLLNALLNKDKEIEELKLKLSRYPFELKDGEKLMTINFIFGSKIRMLFNNM